MKTFLLLFLSLSTLFCSGQDAVDFLSVKAELTPFPAEKRVQGEVTYTFRVLKDTSEVFLDAHHMQIIKSSGSIKIKAQESKIQFQYPFRKNNIYTTTFSYNAYPKQSFYFFPEEEMWTQGQGKYTSHYLPSRDDTNDKMVFNLSIRTRKDQVGLANGILKEVKEEEKYLLWQYEMKHPMSSYLVALAVAEYEKMETKSASGITIEHYFKKDAHHLYDTYRHSVEIFDFLEKELGVDYPWQVYREVPVKDFFYGGMENTSFTIFSEGTMVDAIGFVDSEILNIRAHELAHQWFGNMVTAKPDKHHWLQEGFATYYAYLVQKQLFGDEWYQFKMADIIEKIEIQTLSGNGESLLNSKASSLTFYEKGALVLHILRQKVGDRAFRKSVENYLRRYAFAVATTDDFLAEVKKESDLDTDAFKEKWMKSTSFSAQEAFATIDVVIVKDYENLKQLRDLPLHQKIAQLEDHLSLNHAFLGPEVVQQLAIHSNQEVAQQLLKVALESKDLKTRQKAVLSLQKIPKSFFSIYFRLLDDSSYLTQQVVFSQLWFHFPEDRISILEKMQGRIGFQNRNLRQHYLLFALLTEGYKEHHKQQFFEELQSYTSPLYTIEVRELAFEIFKNLDFWEKESLQNLLSATAHPNWRFAKFTRDILKDLTLEEVHTAALRSMAKELSADQQKFLQTLFEVQED